MIVTLTYSFARITAGLKMKIEDLRPRGRGMDGPAAREGGKQHAMPCHHARPSLRTYIDAAAITEDREG